MNPENPNYQTRGDDTLEARIVAWVLGEASAFEAAELERLCEERPELEVFRRRMMALDPLLKTAERPSLEPGWRLSEARRAVLDEALGDQASPSIPIVVKIPKRRFHYAWLTAAACVLLLVTLSSVFVVEKHTVRETPTIVTYYAHTEEAADGQVAMKNLETNLPPELIEGTPVPITQESLRRERPRVSPAPPAPSSASAKVVSSAQVAGEPVPVPTEIAALDTPSAVFGDEDAFGNGFGGGFLLNEETTGRKSNIDAFAPPNLALSQRDEAPIRSSPALTHEHSQAVDDVRRGLYLAEGNYNLGKFDDAKAAYENVLRTDPYNAAARRGMERIAASKSDYYRAAYDHTRAELLMQVDQAWELAVPVEETSRGDIDIEISTTYSSAFDLPAGGSLSEQSALTGESLDQTIKDLEETVEERRKTLATIMRTRGINYTGEDSFYLGADAGARTALHTYHQLEQEKAQIESQLESLLRYEGDQLMTYAAGLNLPDNQARKLLPEYLELKSQLQAGNPDANDPEATRKKEQLNVLEGQIKEQAANLRATLRAQLELAADRLARVEAMQDDTRDQAIQRGLDAQDYTEAKAAYERDLRRLEEMKSSLREAAPPPDPLAELTLPELVARIDALREKIDNPVITDSNKQSLHRDLQKLQQLAIAKSKAAPPVVPENETSAAADPFSTFSLNVSDASFVIARDAMMRGERPDPGGIRVEQFYNAMDYGDPAPMSGEPVAARIEQAAHPIMPGRNLVRVALRTGSSGRAASQPLDLTLLVDQSGSMQRADRREALDRALAAMAELLGENDRLHVVGFSRRPRIIAEGLPGNRAAELPALVNQQAAEGGTNLAAALELGGQLAARNLREGAQNRLVILSDGAVNLGDADPVQLADQVAQLRQQGVATDIAGIGTDGLNDGLLAELARHGDGRYHVVTPETGDELANALAGAFRPAALDVKVQVVFNPERVGGWKLLGFEEHRLRAEDFRNDAVDAAEMAADEAGVAIYQVETLPNGHGEIGEVFVRFRDAVTGSIVEQSWPLPYDANAPSLDAAQPSMQLATLALMVAEHLAESPLGKSIDMQSHQDVIRSLRTIYQNDRRANELLDMAARIAER